MADSYLERAQKLLRAEGSPVTTTDKQLLLLRDKVAKRMEEEQDPEVVRALAERQQRIEKRLDESFSKYEARGESSLARKAASVPIGIAKGVAKIPAGLRDAATAVGLQIPRVLGLEGADKLQAGPKATELIDSLFPRAVNPAEQRLQGIGEFLGSAGSSGVLNMATRFGGSTLGKLMQGAATDVAATGAGSATEAVTDNPYAPLLAAMAAGGGTEALTSAPQIGQRAVAREVTTGLAPDAPQRMREDIALGERFGFTPTPAQTSAGTERMRAEEERLAAMPGSRIREAQKGQPEAIIAAKPLREFPGEVMDRRLLAELGAKVSGNELQRIKNMANQAYDFFLNREAVTPEQVAKLDQDLLALQRDSRFRDMRDFQNYLTDIRRRIYEPVIIQEPVGGERITRGTGIMGPTGEELTRTEITPITTRETEVIAPVTDANRLKTIQQDVLGTYNPVGAGGSGEKRIQGRQLVEVKKTGQQAIPAIGRADEAYKEIAKEEGLKVKEAKSGLGGWIGPKGVSDKAAAPMGKLSELFDKGIDPELPRTQSPMLRMATQLGKNDEAAKFFANGIKTKLSEVISKANAENTAPFSQIVNDRRLARTIQDGWEAYAIATGRPEAGRQIATGYANLQKVLAMAERRAMAGERLPISVDPLKGEKQGLELAAATMFPSRAVNVAFSKIPYSKMSESVQRFLDEKLTTPEGVDFLMKLAKQNWKTDATQGMVLGFIGQQSQQ